MLAIPYKLTLDFDQILELITQCSLTEKQIILEKIRQDIRPQLTDFIQQINSRNIPLTDAEIQAEVDAVRQERYAKSQTNCY